MQKHPSMSQPERLVTAEELEKFSDDYRYELVEGRLIRMSPVGYQHGVIVVGFSSLLHRHVKARHLGAVTTELGCRLASDPDTVRAPDIAFIRRERIPSPDPRGFWQGAPDLAVEVLSPDDRASEVRAKVAQYLERGVRIVLVVDPDDTTVTVHRRLSAPVTIGTDDELDLDDVVHGFRCSVREVFE